MSRAQFGYVLKAVIIQNSIRGIYNQRVNLLRRTSSYSTSFNDQNSQLYLFLTNLTVDQRSCTCAKLNWVLSGDAFRTKIVILDAVSCKGQRPSALIVKLAVSVPICSQI